MSARIGVRNTVDRVLLFVLTFAVLLTWTLAIARYGGPDEPAHVVRAASVARGELVGSPVSGLPPGFRAVTVPGALATGDPACFRHDASRPSACAAAAIVSGTRRAATSAGTYPPWYYAIVGLPVRWFGNPAAVQSYRIVAALWCALVLVAAMLRSHRFARSGLVLAAISPAAWFLFGVVNPNALEVALMLLAWVCVMVLRQQPSDQRVGDLLWFSAPAGLAILIRPIAVIPWLAMLCVLCLDPMLSRLILSRRASWRMRVAAFGAPLASIVATLLWGWWSSAQVSDRRTASSDSVLSAMWQSVRGTGQTLRELAGSLGWLEFSSPTWTQLLWWIVAAAAMCGIWRERRNEFRNWLAVATLLLVAPIAFETLFANRIGFVWQGRYSISVALGLIVLAIDRPLRKEAFALGSATMMIGAATFVIEVGTFAYVLRRYTVGVNGSALYRNADWQPPIAPIALIALNAVVMAGLLVMRQRTSVAR